MRESGERSVDWPESLVGGFFEAEGVRFSPIWRSQVSGGVSMRLIGRSSTLLGCYVPRIIGIGGLR
jgi:hypothetical protein